MLIRDTPTFSFISRAALIREAFLNVMPAIYPRNLVHSFLPSLLFLMHEQLSLDIQSDSQELMPETGIFVIYWGFLLAERDESNRIRQNEELSKHVVSQSNPTGRSGA